MIKKKIHVSKSIIVIISLALTSFTIPFFSSLCMAALIAFALKPLQKKWLQKKLNLSKTLSVYLILFFMLLGAFPFILSFLRMFSLSEYIFLMIF